MIEKGRRTGTARFSLKPHNSARRVQLAGDFANWKPLTMRRQKDGTFVAIVAIQPGTYEYKFIVDGEWQTDPDSHCWSANPSGTMNSVASVGQDYNVSS